MVWVTDTRNGERNLYDQFDVIVIGGGINGAWIARDAAMRGLKVVLLDKASSVASVSRKPQQEEEEVDEVEVERQRADNSIRTDATVRQRDGHLL